MIATSMHTYMRYSNYSVASAHHIFLPQVRKMNAKVTSKYYSFYICALLDIESITQGLYILVYEFYFDEDLIGQLICPGWIA